MKPGRTALVLSGGGARGAYQAGLIAGLVEIASGKARRPLFDVYVGSSAGAINAAMLAAHADNPRAGTAALDKLWRTIEPHRVFRTDLASLGSIGLRWAWDLSFGGVLSHVRPKSLLDTAPLRKLLAHVPFDRLQRNVRDGTLYALAVAATDLYSSTGFLFVDGQREIQPWRRSRWQIELAPIGIDHLMASSAIPIFFPSVQIGERHFGDGSIRNTAPLSPAIHLGADRIVTVSVQPAAAVLPAQPEKRPAPTIAQIAGTMLDAVMLDSVETDVEHSGRVNASVRQCRAVDCHNPFRRIEVLWLKPEVDFGALARELADRMPPILRYLLRGLGSDEAITELLSYLLFDPVFCGRLLDLGHEDARRMRPEIEEFLADERPMTALAG